MSLSDTHLMVLSAAAARQDKLVTKHKRLPGASLQKVCAALEKKGLLAAITGPSHDPDVLQVKDETGNTAFAITGAGLAAIGVDDERPYGEDNRPRDERLGVDPRLIDGPENDPAPEPAGAPTGAEDAMTATTLPDTAEGHPTGTVATPHALRHAAQRVLAAWDDEENRTTDIIGVLEGPIQALRTALVGKPSRTPREPGAPRKPREGTKNEAVLALLRRDEGTTITQICEATGWQQHTVRGFFAGLKRKGITVEVLERIRQVGPNKEGAKGSYSVYRVA
jgi:hypothetical protein